MKVFRGFLLVILFFSLSLGINPVFGSELETETKSFNFLELKNNDLTLTKHVTEIETEIQTNSLEIFGSYGSYRYMKLGTSNDVIISDYTGNDKVITIPATLAGYRVVGIGMSAFSNKQYTEEIIVSEGIEYFTSMVFQNCPKLRKVTLPQTLTDMGNNPFDSCVKLEYINIPDQITSLSKYTFVDSPSLIIYGKPGLYGQRFAEQVGITFIGIDTMPFRVDNFIVDKPSGQYINTYIALSATGSGGVEPYNYKFYYKFDENYINIQEYSDINTAYLTLTSSGSYIFYVDIKDANGNITTGTIDNYEVMNFPISTQVLYRYRTHVQDYGWQEWKLDGAVSGTSGESKRLEAIQIDFENESTGVNEGVSVEYQTHVQDYGWQGWRQDGSICGTSGESKRLEAIQIRLIGANAELYDIYYQVHAQNFGWLGWAKNGEKSGTAGYGYRLEGIKIIVVLKEDPIPPTDSTLESFYQF